MLPAEQCIKNIFIEDEIKRSYLDYAMSVIIGRALPDVRDGLKPVHRRILFAMHNLKNNFNKPYKKSARVVGDVIGKYHPHGENAVYDALVRMAQNFSLRYILINGQGNFGSIDGDAPAAMRYTEIRMTKLAHEFLEDIDKETVPFTNNYDGSLQEPIVMPTKIPNLLINGSSGIAVGMATNIPPHNLSEVTKAIIALIDDPTINISTLMKYIPGPDFPTRGFINGTNGIKSAYTTGHGIIHMRARTNIENYSHSKKKIIIINELPYQVNKAKLIEHIANLVKNKKIEGITDIRDESDRNGLRIVLEIKREARQQIILNQLFKLTQMQSTFSVNLLAIVNNRPELLNLKQILALFINHRRTIILKRTIFNLNKTKTQAHILNGFRIALEHLDQVIQTIRTAKNPLKAKTALITQFKLNDTQSEAILNTRLQRLTNLEREKILQEHKDINKEIIKLQTIINSKQLVYNIIRKEVLKSSEIFADKRRTEIISQPKEVKLENIIIEEDMIVTLSHAGYIKRTPINLYRSQRRGGKGQKDMITKKEDFVESLLIASTHNYLLVFTNLGRLHWLKVYELPQAGRTSKGKNIINLLNLLPGEKIATVLAIRNFSEGNKIVMATEQGIIKKTNLMNFSRPRIKGIIAINVNKNNRLISACLTNGNMEIFLVTRQGQAIRFKEKQVRSMGRTATGVRGITLSKNDKVVSMEVLTGAPFILTVTANGYGKCTSLYEYPLQNRRGKGVITIKTTNRNGPVIGAMMVKNTDEVMLSSDKGNVIRLKIKDISNIGRNTQGVKLKNLNTGEHLVSAERLVERE